MTPFISYDFDVSLGEALKPELRDLNNAQRNLEESLKICPDCSEAKELLDQIAEDKERAKQLIESGKSSIRAATFTKAKNEIAQAECIWRKVPQLSQTWEKLETTQRSYNKHIDAARELYENNKDLGPALKRVEEALKVCSLSTKAKTLKNKIAGDRKKVIDLLYKATLLIPKADFVNASKYIEEAESIWPNLAALHRLKDDLKDRRNAYSEHFKRATDFYEKKDLDSASRDAGNALNICTQSDEANRLLEKIVSNRKKALSLIDRIQSLMLSADFSNASKHINEAECIWTNVPGLVEARDDLIKRRTVYDESFKKATDLYKKKDLDAALKSVKTALSICAQSKEAKLLLNSIVNDQEKAIRLIKDIQSLLISAGFAIANMKMKDAQSIWPKAPDLNRARRNLDIKKKEYDNFYYKAKKLFDRGKELDVALKNVRSSLKVCLESGEAKSLKKEILSLIEKKAKRRRTFRDKILMPVFIVGGVPLFWLLGSEFLKTVFPNILEYRYLCIVLGISFTAFLLTSILVAIDYHDPSQSKEEKHFRLVFFWISWGLTNIIPCLVFRYVFHKTWVIAASVSLTISGILTLACLVILVALTIDD